MLTIVYLVRLCVYNDAYMHAWGAKSRKMAGGLRLMSSICFGYLVLFSFILQARYQRIVSKELSHRDTDGLFKDGYSTSYYLQFIRLQVKKGSSQLGSGFLETFFKQRISYYINHVASFSLRKSCLVNVHPNPGPVRDAQTIQVINRLSSLNFLSLNARSNVNKTVDLNSDCFEIIMIC